MFTGIIQSVATIAQIQDKEGLRTLTLSVEKAFCKGLKVGASVAVDGVCLTVTQREKFPASPICRVSFDVIDQTLVATTLGELTVGSKVNVERAAKQGAEVGGHELSGHVDGCGRIIAIEQPPNNYLLRIAVPSSFMRYLFKKGYIGLHGASLTISDINREENWFEVWLIPETLRATTLGEKKIDDQLNMEINRETQVTVDTIYMAISDNFAKLMQNRFCEERILKNEVSALQLQLLTSTNNHATR